MTMAPRDGWQVRCLEPDLPEAGKLAPYLREMQENRWYTNFGPLVLRFEDALAHLFGAGKAVSTFSSATTALELMLEASSLSKGARVLVPSLTFPATGLAVYRAGMMPVIADVEASGCQLTPEIARDCLDRAAIDAVIVVAPFGLPVDLAPWEAFKKGTGLPVFLDAAAAFPAQKVSDTIPAVFSFHATKPFGIGEGGVLVSGDKALVADARRLSNFGFDSYRTHGGGTNAKMGEYYAAVGLEQLKRLDAIESRRRAVWQAYETALAPFEGRVQLVRDRLGSVPATLVCDFGEDALAVEDRCSDTAIQTRRWYIPPLHDQPSFAEAVLAGTGEGGLPVTAERLKSRLLGLPFHSFLTSEDIEKVACAIAEGLDA